MRASRAVEKLLRDWGWDNLPQNEDITKAYTEENGRV